jgi:GT2 family glycosyltransferase
VKRGLAVAQSEIVAVMDDDAEAQDDWAARMLPHYADPTIGAVGGRCINMEGDQRIPSPSTSRVGYVTWLGQFVGNMYCEPTFTKPVEVDFMMGGNMSFRREVAQRIEFDMELNRNVAQGYEVDIGLQVKAMGWKIIFDPRLAIRHYTAPRAEAGMRPDADRESVQWYSYNHARVALRRLRVDRRVAAIAYQFAIGERRAPGVLPLLLSPIARALGFSTRAAGPAFKGRMLAVRSVLPRGT